MWIAGHIEHQYLEHTLPLWSTPGATLVWGSVKHFNQMDMDAFYDGTLWLKDNSWRQIWHCDQWYINSVEPFILKLHTKFWSVSWKCAVLSMESQKHQWQAHEK